MHGSLAAKSQCAFSSPSFHWVRMWLAQHQNCSLHNKRNSLFQKSGSNSIHAIPFHSLIILAQQSNANIFMLRLILLPLPFCTNHFFNSAQFFCTVFLHSSVVHIVCMLCLILLRLPFFIKRFTILHGSFARCAFVV